MPYDNEYVDEDQLTPKGQTKDEDDGQDEEPEDPADNTNMGTEGEWAEDDETAAPWGVDNDDNAA